MVIKLELYVIVLHKYKKQLNLLIFKVIIDYDLNVLTKNSLIQLMHHVTIKFDLVFVI